MIKTVSSPSSLTYDRTSGISVVARTAANAAPATTRFLHHLAFGVHWTAAVSCCTCAMRRAGFTVRITVSLPVRFPGPFTDRASPRSSIYKWPGWLSTCLAQALKSSCASIGKRSAAAFSEHSFIWIPMQISGVSTGSSTSALTRRPIARAINT